jgi:hypothetical protein
MMRLFQELARAGRTVVCVTHFPPRLDLCDRLIVVAEGQLVFSGSPAELRTFFGVASIEEIFIRQRERPVAEWRWLFLSSTIGQARRSSARTPDRTNHHGIAVPPNLDGMPDWPQPIELTARFVRILLADADNLSLLVFQAPVIAWLIGVTFGEIRGDFAELQAADTKQVHFLLALSVLWCTGTISVREIVKELPIVRHERRARRSLVPYLLSKFMTLGSLGLVQAVLLLMIVGRMTQMSGDPATQFCVLGMTALTGVALGLAVSALAGTSERALTALPVVLIGQAIFSGGLVRLSGCSRLAGMMSSAAYWALDGLRSTLATDLKHASYPGAPGHFQPPILGDGGPVFLDVGGLGIQLAVLPLSAYAALAVRRGNISRWRRAPPLRSSGSGAVATVPRPSTTIPEFLRA